MHTHIHACMHARAHTHTHTHTHRGICTPMHSDYTELNLHSLQMGSRQRLLIYSGYDCPFCRESQSIEAITWRSGVPGGNPQNTEWKDPAPCAEGQSLAVIVMAMETVLLGVFPHSRLDVFMFVWDRCL